MMEYEPYVSTATLDHTRLNVDLRGTGDPAPLVTFLVNQGVAIEEVRRGAASLEEVFLSLMQETTEEEEPT
jgi:hypothetical protein